jgi:hypothetical protein
LQVSIQRSVLSFSCNLLRSNDPTPISCARDAALALVYDPVDPLWSGIIHVLFPYNIPDTHIFRRAPRFCDGTYPLGKRCWRASLRASDQLTHRKIWDRMGIANTWNLELGRGDPCRVRHPKETRVRTRRYESWTWVGEERDFLVSGMVELIS